MQKRATKAARFGEELWDAGSGDGSNRQCQKHLLHRLVQGGARFLFATTAAVRTARASLQLGELMDTFAGGPADVAVRDGVAHADIHGTYGNANANDCQLNNWTVTSRVIQLPSGIVKKAIGRTPALPSTKPGSEYASCWPACQAAALPLRGESPASGPSRCGRSPSWTLSRVSTSGAKWRRARS